MEILIGVFVGLVFGFILYRLFSKKSPAEDAELKNTVAQTLELKLRELMPILQNQANESLVRMADQKLGAEKREIKTDLENKRSEIERLVALIKEDIKNSDIKLDQAEKERIGSFRALQNALETQKELTSQLSVSTEKLQKVLSNNQMRGQFGEQVAENLLKMTGFVRGVDYEYNKEQENVDTRPDFTVKLPDGTKINIDAKFPYAELQKLVDADTDVAKEEHRKLFEQDVKNKIKQVSTRDYINPEENTVDFVILFIPNEMIFSYIYDKMNDIWSSAMRNKVVLAGPFSFTAILRMVRQAYDNFHFQKNIREVVTHVKMFEKEFSKFSDEFQKVGDRIEGLQKQYQSVAITRVNKLAQQVEKVRLEGSAIPELESQSDDETP